MRYPVLCFDLDGTIMKTDEGVVLSHRYAAEKLKLKDLPYDRPDLFIGPSNYTFCTQTLGLDEETAALFDRYMLEEYSRVSLDYSQVYDGMMDLLRDTREAGCKNFICTAKNEAAAIALGEAFGFGAYIDGTVGALDGGDEKHMILQRLIDSYSIRPSDIAMIGDRYTDLEGGRRCGTHTVGVLYGYGLLEEIEACAPDHIAKSVEDLRTILFGCVD